MEGSIEVSGSLAPFGHSSDEPRYKYKAFGHADGFYGNRVKSYSGIHGNEWNYMENRNVNYELESYCTYFH